MNYQQVGVAIAILLLVITISPSAFAENRWVIGLRAGSGVGLLGLELERELSGFSLLATGGSIAGTTGAGIGFRLYWGQRKASRIFLETLGGINITTQENVTSYSPFIGLAAGYDWRMRTFRISIEGGLGSSLITLHQFPTLALSTGLSF